MAKRMLIDATQPEETRVAVVSGNRLDEYDFETATKKQLKGNIYLAKVVRVEPSLQAAFVEYGGNRHGFLAFSEIHPDYYRIPVEDRQALIAEERELARDEDRIDAMGLDAEASTAAVERPATIETVGGAAEAPTGEEGAAAPLAEAGGFAPIADEAALAPPAETPAEEPAAGGAGATDFPVFEFAPEPEHGEESAAEAAGAEETILGAGYESAEEAHNGEAEGGEQPAGEGTGGHGDGEATAESYRYPPQDAASEPHAEEVSPAPSGPPRERVETLGGEEIETDVPRRRHPSRRYKIQEVIKRRQVMLVQVTKEERGTKGAALTTRLSLAGRYCVLMPNTGRGGGISRKITTAQDRKKLREIVDALDIPEGISVIVRTAGANRSKAEIKRDFDYLLRLWSDIRELTLKSSAPALIYEEANLIKRSIRDLYAREMDDILVEGEEAYKLAKEFMRTLMPSHAKRVQPYRSPTVPLFQKFQIESQIAAIHQPLTRLKSGGYIVINQTEALVAIDVNSGRSTRERNIEETATQTNLEAADEIARQLRLRDLAGLIVIDFIDMENERNRRAVEKRLKDALKNDRARIQLGRISHFGLLEMSRQRLRPSLHEFSTERCPHCQGTGVVRSTESTALQLLRAVEEEGLKKRSAEIAVFAPPKVALFILNQKRSMLTGIEGRHRFQVLVNQDEALVPPDFRIEVTRTRTPAEIAAAEEAAREAAPPAEFEPEPEPEMEPEFSEEEALEPHVHHEHHEEAAEERPHRRRHGGERPEAGVELAGEAFAAGEDEGFGGEARGIGEQPGGEEPRPGGDQMPRKRRRRGKRGGRRRRGGHGPGEMHGPVQQGEEVRHETAAQPSETPSQMGEPHQGGEGRRRRRRRRGRGGNGARPPEQRGVPGQATTTEPGAAASPAGQQGFAPREAPREPAERHEPARKTAAETRPVTSEARETEASDRPKRRGWWQRLVE